MKKEYSEISFGIDLISDAYNTTNPIIIAEKLHEDLDIDVTIDDVMNYYDTMKITYEYEPDNYYYLIN